MFRPTRRVSADGRNRRGWPCAALQLGLRQVRAPQSRHWFLPPKVHSVLARRLTLWFAFRVETARHNAAPSTYIHDILSRVNPLVFAPPCAARSPPQALSSIRASDEATCFAR